MAGQTDFGKGALITGIVLGVAAGAFGVYNMTTSKVDRPQTRLNVEASSAEMQLVQVAEAAVREGKKDVTIKDVAPEGATIDGKPRYAPIFLSPELWQVNDDAKKDTTVIDIYDPSSPDVHPGVPNHWFTANGLREALTSRSGLTMDSDGDGFSNKEEYDAKTNPSDAADMPSLVQSGKEPKLQVVGSPETKLAVIAVDSSLAYASEPTEAAVRIYAAPGSTKTLSRFDKLTPGSTFKLRDDDVDKRFEVVGFEKTAYGSASEFALRLKDNAVPARPKEIVVRAGSPSRSKDNSEAARKGYVVEDVYVTLRVTAGPDKDNKEKGTFRVLVGADFEVPGSKGITCELKSVNSDGSVSIQPAGYESAITVPKGE